MIEFTIEPLMECWNGCVALARQHWQETEGYRHGQPFNPLLVRYLEYERCGWFFMCCARDTGDLVGYAGMYVSDSMHSQLKIATEDTFFLRPSHRKGRNAIRFVKFIEAECKARGAIEIMMTAKKSVHRILAYMDYEAVAVTYSKSLTGADSAGASPPSPEASNGVSRFHQSHGDQDPARSTG